MRYVNKRIRPHDCACRRLEEDECTVPTFIHPSTTECFPAVLKTAGKPSQAGGGDIHSEDSALPSALPVKRRHCSLRVSTGPFIPSHNDRASSLSAEPQAGYEADALRGLARKRSDESLLLIYVNARFGARALDEAAPRL